MVAYQPVILDPENPLGAYTNVYEARAVDKRVRSLRRESGGAVTALLLYLLENHVIDAVIVAKRSRGFRGEAIVAKTPEEILDAAGSRWSIVPYTLELKEKLTSSEVGRVAFIGLPCQAQFLNQMKRFPLMESDFGRKIHLIISLFCIGTFAVESFIDYIKRSYSVEPDNITSIDIVDDKLLVKHDRGEIEIPIKDALYHLQHGCLTCPDYTGVFADISAGRSPRTGYTILITRSKYADKIVHEAGDKGYIELVKVDEATVKSIAEKSREKIMRSYKYLARVL